MINFTAVYSLFMIRLMSDTEQGDYAMNDGSKLSLPHIDQAKY